MNLFNELVNQLLSAESIIEEAKRNIEDVTGRDEKAGQSAEKLFADVLKKRFGSGKFFKSKNQPKGAYTKAQEELAQGKIAWYSGSEKQDKIDHIDFMANVAPRADEGQILDIAKKDFAVLIGFDENDTTNPEFDEYWNEPSYQKERDSAFRTAMSTIEQNKEFNIQGFEVKSYKGETKAMYGKGGAVIVELVGGGGHPGWLMGKADFIAYRENKGFAVPSSGRQDLSNGFIIVSRPQLLDYVRATVPKDQETSVKQEAWYMPYRRKDMNGNPKKDLVAYIDLLDAKQNGVYMEFWPDA